MSETADPVEYWMNRYEREKARADAADGHSNELLRRAVNAERALAAARRECELVKESLREALAGTDHDPACKWDYCMCWQRKARAALAAPAAGEEGKR